MMLCCCTTASVATADSYSSPASATPRPRTTTTSRRCWTPSSTTCCSTSADETHLLSSFGRGASIRRRGWADGYRQRCDTAPGRAAVDAVGFCAVARAWSCFRTRVGLRHPEGVRRSGRSTRRDILGPAQHDDRGSKARAESSRVVGTCRHFAFRLPFCDTVRSRLGAGWLRVVLSRPASFRPWVIEYGIPSSTVGAARPGDPRLRVRRRARRPCRRRVPHRRRSLDPMREGVADPRPSALTGGRTTSDRRGARKPHQDLAAQQSRRCRGTSGAHEASYAGKTARLRRVDGPSRLLCIRYEGRSRRSTPATISQFPPATSDDQCCGRENQ